MTCFSTLPGAEFPRRETKHEKPNLHHNQRTLQELVPQQEQHILDHRLPSATNRPLWRNLRQRKHQVRPIPPKPGPDRECADASLPRIRQRAEPNRRLQPPHSRSRATRPADICEKRCSRPQSRPETASHTLRLQRYYHEWKECDCSTLHGPERPSLRITRWNSALSHRLVCSCHRQRARPPSCSTSRHRNPEYPLHRLLHPRSNRHDPPHHRRLWRSQHERTLPRTEDHQETRHHTPQQDRMDTWHGWLPDDLGDHIAHRHSLLRLCHLRGDGYHRHLHRRTCGSSRPPLPRHRNGTRKFRERSRERRRRGKRVNIPHDVPGGNLLAPRHTALYHEDHSQLHATNIHQRRTARRADLCGTSPSPDQHPNRPRTSSLLHRTRQHSNELEGRIAPKNIDLNRSYLKFGTLDGFAHGIAILGQDPRRSGRDSRLRPGHQSSRVDTHSSSDKGNLRERSG